jgi:nitroreductase
MTFEHALRSRFSVRRYLPRPVESEKLDRILEAGRIAPSACNLQPWVFLVAQSDDALARVRGVYPREWFAAAPVVIAVCGRRDVAWRRGDGKLHMDIDAAIAADHMSLAAVAEGLGSCWVCAFDAVRFSQEFALPPEVEPIILLPLGYPAEKADPKRHATMRKPLDEIVDRR